MFTAVFLQSETRLLLLAFVCILPSLWSVKLRYTSHNKIHHLQCMLHCSFVNAMIIKPLPHFNSAPFLVLEMYCLSSIVLALHCTSSLCTSFSHHSSAFGLHEFSSSEHFLQKEP